MNTKKKLITLLFISIISFFIALILVFSISLNICLSNDVACINNVSINWGQQLIQVSISMFLSVVVLFLASEETFKIWKKFALVAIPLIFIWIYSTPVYCHATLNLCFSKSQVTFISSLGFFIITMGIVLFKTLKSRFKK